MCILLIKTGVEQHANRVFTSDFFLPPANNSEEMTRLTDHATYTPHEQIICGINGIFGQWEIGHIILQPGAKIFGVFTRKVLAYDPHNQTRSDHKMIQCVFNVTCGRVSRYVLNYWGYNDGEKVATLLSGGFRLEEEKKEPFKIGTALSKLPF